MKVNKKSKLQPSKEKTNNPLPTSGSRRLSAKDNGKESALSAAPLAWPTELIAQLGVMTDIALAEKFATTVAAIRKQRAKLGIPVAKRTSPKKTDWTQQMDALLGTDTDAAIAKLLGVSSVTVNQRRLRLQIPSFRAQCIARGIPMPQRSSNDRTEWTPAMDALLGTDLDLIIGRKLGLSYKKVGIRRKVLGIAPFKNERQ